MFGLSWAQIGIILLVGVFVLGPERIPTAVTWVMSSLRKLRSMAAGAQAELRKEIGPELEELRRQVADLQSLKEIQKLRELRDLHPKRLIGKGILGEEFSGGIGGFLGLNNPGQNNPSLNNNPVAPAAAPPIGQDAPAVPANMAGQPAPVIAAVPAAKPDPVFAPSQRSVRALDVGERPPFDPDGT